MPCFATGDTNPTMANKRIAIDEAKGGVDETQEMKD
jgi:hypothetical protein